MKLRQYVEFGVRSETLSPEQLTERIGVEPDKVVVMGSRRQLPRPVPRSHRWIVRCDSAQLSVGRWFGDDDGEEEVGVVKGADGSTLREGVWLYGWHLDREVLEFLVDIGADLDVDEYDMLQVEENFAWPDEQQ
jgi:hypothetical protein